MGIDVAESQARNPSRRTGSRQTVYFPRQGVGAALSGDMSAALQAYSQKVQQQVLRSGVYAGAKLLTEELERNVPVDKGVLKASIYTYHDDKRSVGGRQVYVVGVNKREARHWYNVEYGHWRINVVVRGPNGRMVFTKERLPAPVWVPAHPYLRPTADRMPDALEAVKARLAERLQEVAQEGGAT